ncbi:MAG: NAD(P)/FAD-dependent oxidoreductase [Armatimonadetes bacterium]|nr:NAD(P)/FAD-dependent oxidoreductase [Armatimonadota bacterium]
MNSNTQIEPVILEEPSVYEAIVIGGSYAGLSAAVQLVRARRQVLILDTGKPRNRFAHASHGFFGQDGSSPKAMIDAARKQVMAYPTARFRQAEATHAEQSEEGFRVTLADGSAVRAKRLVLATGVKDNLPDVPGLKELWGTGVAHCPYCHGYEFGGRKLAVLGVSESSVPASVHAALLLRDWSEDVTLLLNGTKGLSAEDRERLTARDVKIEAAPVERLIPKGHDLEAVEFADGRKSPFAAMFLPTRTSLSSSIAEQLGCEMEDGMSGQVVKTDARKESTVAGVYVAGDSTSMGGSAIFAAADGCRAGSMAHQSLVFPKKAS